MQAYNLFPNLAMTHMMWSDPTTTIPSFFFSSELIYLDYKYPYHISSKFKRGLAFWREREREDPKK